MNSGVSGRGEPLSKKERNCPAQAAPDQVNRKKFRRLPLPPELRFHLRKSRPMRISAEKSAGYEECTSQQGLLIRGPASQGERVQGQPAGRRRIRLCFHSSPRQTQQFDRSC